MQIIIMEIINVWYFRNCSSNALHVCCADSLTDGLYDHCQSDDLEYHWRSQLRIKLDYFLTCNIVDNIKLLHSRLAWTVDLCMALKLTLILKTFVKLVLLCSCFFSCSLSLSLSLSLSRSLGTPPSSLFLLPSRPPPHLVTHTAQCLNKRRCNYLPPGDRDQRDIDWLKAYSPVKKAGAPRGFRWVYWRLIAPSRMQGHLVALEGFIEGL